MPALLFSYKTWILTLEEQQKLIQTQSSVSGRIPKLPSSQHSFLSLWKQEVPMILEYEKHQLTYIRILLNATDQT